MGNAFYSDQQSSCHESLEICKAHCDKSECVFVDKCNDAGQKFVCVPVDIRFIMWLMLGCFLIVLLVCSSLVACYACRAFRYASRHAVRTNNEIIFPRAGPVHYVNTPTQHYHRR